MKIILKFFSANPIDPEENVSKRFPKYIKDPLLFPYQIMEPFFRKSFLVQLRMIIFSATNPLKSTTLKFGPFSEQELQKVKEHQELIDFLLKRYKVGQTKKNLDQVIEKVFTAESGWMNWKDSGCHQYNQEISQEKKKLIQNSQPILKFDDSQYQQQKLDLSTWMDTNKEYSHMEALDKSNLTIAEKSIEPSMSRYMIPMIGEDQSATDMIEELSTNSVSTQ